MASEGLTYLFIAQVYGRLGVIQVGLGLVTDGFDTEFLGAN